MTKLYEIQHVHFRSLLKIAAVLGILWGAVGWIVGGIAILIIKMYDPSVDPASLPSAFSIADLFLSLLGSFIGSIITAAIGALAYNRFARKHGGIIISLQEKEAPPQVIDPKEETK